MRQHTYLSYQKNTKPSQACTAICTRGVPNAQIFRFFKKAYFSTGAYPIPIIWDKKIENRINFWRARPDFLVPGGLGHPQVPGVSLFGRNWKLMWKPYTGSIFDFMDKNFSLVIFRTSFSKKLAIFATFFKNPNFDQSNKRYWQNKFEICAITIFWTNFVFTFYQFGQNQDFWKK